MSTPPYVPALDFSPALRDDALSVMRRLVGLFREGGTDRAPEQYVEPVANYRDPDVWAREVEQIHRRVPLAVALSAELPEPGSYKAVEVVGTPVLITRDRSGGVHAFVNACRHRGAELLAGGTGRARRITCPYHAWSYDLAGCLVGVYGEETFGPVDRSTMGLLTLPAAERAGFVFISLDRTATLDLDAWLGDMAPLLDGLGLDRCHHHGTTHLPGPNWKLVVDGYLEGYHFASLHTNTVFRTNHSNMATFDSFGPHMRVAFALKTIGGSADLPEESWEPAANVGPIFWLFPGIAIAGGWRRIVEVSIVLPGTSWDTSTTEQHTLLREPPVDDEEVKVADHARDWFYEVTLEEDYRTGEGVQRGLDAMTGTDLVFGRNEPGVQHFHRTVAGMIGTPGA
ncbi:aromatic ring-hydroxylating oxygenase subunit alpha [Trujillonella humicola]|uniref:aromatic ring-hydroxylating oxygenase subunit alpha n=1 Tax=Trujillonella humicola TaxID=3383699 RepID=UPI003905F29D